MRSFDGSVVTYILPEVYHGSPVGDGRALVTWDLGRDFERRFTDWTGYLLSTFVIKDRTLGIDGEFLEVFVASKNELNRVVPSGLPKSPPASIEPPRIPQTAA